MGNVNIRNVNIRNIKFKWGQQDKQRKLELKLLQFQGFKFELIWEMSALEMSRSEGARKIEVPLFKFQGFKVSNLRWRSNMGNINIRNVSIQNTKCRMQCQTAKILGEGFNVTLRSNLCYNILIYRINLSNLWRLAAHWDSWNVFAALARYDRSDIDRYTLIWFWTVDPHVDCCIVGKL